MNHPVDGASTLKGSWVPACVLRRMLRTRVCVIVRVVLLSVRLFGSHAPGGGSPFDYRAQTSFDFQHRVPRGATWNFADAPLSFARPCIYSVAIERGLGRRLSLSLSPYIYRALAIIARKGEREIVSVAFVGHASVCESQNASFNERPLHANTLGHILADGKGCFLRFV